MIRSTHVDKIPTKICPDCGNRVNRRVRQCCPYCGNHIEGMRVPNRGEYAEGDKDQRTIYVRSRARMGDLVKLMQDYIRTEIGNKEWLVADWGRECGQAGLLLAYCECERDVAEAVIQAHFDPRIRDSLRIRKTVRSMAHIISEYGYINVALNWAKGVYGKSRAKPIQQLGLGDV